MHPSRGFSRCRAAAIAFLAAGLAQGAGREPELARVESLVVDATNAYRAKEGAPRVERDARLDATAHEFASYLAKTGKLDHDADGSTPFERARRHGYDFCLLSENIAYQFDTRGFSTQELARLFTEGWKNSPGHRKNMLDRGATQGAVAVARAPREGYYYAVQMFGRPRTARGCAARD